MPDFFLDVAPDTIIKNHTVKVEKPKKEVKSEKAAADVDKIFHSIEANMSQELVNKVINIYEMGRRKYAFCIFLSLVYQWW